MPVLLSMFIMLVVASKILSDKVGPSSDWPVGLVGLPALSACLFCFVSTASALKLN